MAVIDGITTKDVLERAYANIQTGGWWGRGRNGKTFYSRKKRSQCNCAGLAILDACVDLGIHSNTVFDLLSEDACKVFLDVTSYDRETHPTPKGVTQFGHVTRWNDVPGRHVATVKRAFVRAIKAAA